MSNLFDHVSNLFDHPSRRAAPRAAQDGLATAGRPEQEPADLLPLEFWYDEDVVDDDEAAVLKAVREYREALAALERRTEAALRLGGNDLLALRFLLAQAAVGHPVAAKDLSARLRMSTAATAVLLGRLERSGHLERYAHPTDRRVVLVRPTVYADEQIRSVFGEVHQRTRQLVSGLHPTQASAVVDFLQKLREATDVSAP